MHRPIVLLAVLALAIGLAVGGFAVAQDQGTPAAGGATPDAALCATPLAGADGTPAVAVGTPATVVAAPTTAATPGGAAPGTPVGLFPCPTPIDATPVDATPAGQGAPAGAAPAAPVTVTFVDVAFEPSRLRIPADTDVVLRFVNNGVAPHNFKIDSPEVFSGDLTSGASAEVTVNLPAGTYDFYCAFPGHADAGMVGTLTAE